MQVWFTEDWTPHMRLSLKTARVLHREESAYQEIAVLESVQLGRVLILDDVIQTTEKDEFAYHEMLVHVPMNVHRCPQRVLVIGGGDGGTIREVLRHDTVKRAVMVEIDQRVVEVSREYLPSLSSAFSDPRLELVFGDGIEYVREHKDAFDVIVIDSTDPVGVATGLFSGSFYRNVKDCLTEEGLFTQQTASPFFNRPLLRRIQRDLASIFPVSTFYLGFVPAYPGGLWSYSLGSRLLDPRDFDASRARALEGRYYNEEVHQAALVLPPFCKALLPSSDGTAEVASEAEEAGQ